MIFHPGEKWKRLKNFWQKKRYGSLANYNLHRAFQYDLERVQPHLGGVNKGSLEWSEAVITLHYHCLEKGITMPEFSLGHSGNVVLKLVDEMHTYETAGYDVQRQVFRHAVAALREYSDLHRAAHYELAKDVQQAMDSILQRYDIPASHQAETTAKEYWAHTEAPFPEFAASRHSVRHFAGRVPEEDMHAALSLACNAPLACNRRIVRVHYYKGEAAQKMLSYQNGNRGFGHLCEQLLVVTADLRTMISYKERDCVYTNAGIFTMNLSYALTYYHIAHCMLNWGTTIECDRDVRRIADIPEHEVIAVMIACGKTPEHFRLALSPRCKAEDILVDHGE